MRSLDQKILRYKPEIESYARSLTRRLGNMHYDDLVQVGLIEVWKQLRKSDKVSMLAAHLAMKRYLKRSVNE